LTEKITGAMTHLLRLQKLEIRVNVFTFGANTASAEDGIYLLDAWTTIGSIIDNEGNSAHSLHLFANDVRVSPFFLSFIFILYK
jgi:hypothetical protein